MNEPYQFHTGIPNMPMKAYKKLLIKAIEVHEKFNLYGSAEFYKAKLEQYKNAPDNCSLYDYMSVERMFE